MPYSYFEQCCGSQYGIFMGMLQKDSAGLTYDIGLTLQNSGLLMKTEDGGRDTYDTTRETREFQK